MGANIPGGPGAGADVPGILGAVVEVPFLLCSLSLTLSHGSRLLFLVGVGSSLLCWRRGKVKFIS